MSNFKKLLTSLLFLLLCVNSFAQENVGEYKFYERPYSNSLHFNGNFGFVTSSIKQNKNVYKWRPIYGYDIDYFYQSPGGFVCNLSFMQSSVKCNELIKLTYVGVGFGYGITSDKWRLGATIGFGHVNTNIHAGSLQNGAGLMGIITYEYALSRHLGLGIDFHEFKSVFSGNDNLRPFNGVNVMNLSAGIRYYFKIDGTYF